MGLMEDIAIEKQKTKIPKWKKLKKYELEINEMINSNISIKKQVELILKNEILEKLDTKEYRNILIQHFKYQPKPTKKPTTINQQQNQQTNNHKKITQNQQPQPQKKLSVKEKLSQEVDLFAT